MLRANSRVLGSALLSALGLLPLACGGAFKAQEEGDSGSSSGGSGSSGSSAGGNGSAGKPPIVGGSSSAGTGSGGASGGSPSGGSASGGSSSKFPCVDPTPVGAGYEACANGTLHRPSIERCASALPRPGAQKIAPPGDGQCQSDADCADMPHGYCTIGLQLPGSVCAYGCVEDSECAAGSICVCGDPVGRCVSAECTSDADCGPQLRCQSYDPSHGCGGQRFACQTSGDTCGGDADCAGGYCDAASGAFACVNGGCAVGRPFLVEGQQRRAAVARRADWLVALPELEPTQHSPELRRRLAEAWANIGQMEHASVAAFARFALQLLELGAPAELLELATQAMSDETRHARQAFALASLYAGEKLGPAQLDVEHCLDESSLLDVVRLTVREGCIGETCAALEAREAAAQASDPRLAALLGGVADDEARHAELAWRFVSWALEQAPLAVAALLEREVMSRPKASPAAHSADPSLLPHGIVDEGLRASVREAAMAEVVVPCAAALLGRARSHTAENPVLSA